jgi:hypothetical protein
MTLVHITPFGIEPQRRKVTRPIRLGSFALHLEASHRLLILKAEVRASVFGSPKHGHSQDMASKFGVRVMANAARSFHFFGRLSSYKSLSLVMFMYRLAFQPRRRSGSASPSTRWPATVSWRLQQPEMREFGVSLWSLVIFFLFADSAISQATKIARFSDAGQPHAESQPQAEPAGVRKSPEKEMGTEWRFVRELLSSKLAKARWKGDQYRP